MSFQWLWHRSPASMLEKHFPRTGGWNPTLALHPLDSPLCSPIRWFFLLKVKQAESNFGTQHLPKYQITNIIRLTRKVLNLWFANRATSPGYINLTFHQVFKGNSAGFSKKLFCEAPPSFKFSDVKGPLNSAILAFREVWRHVFGAGEFWVERISLGFVPIFRDERLAF